MQAENYRKAGITICSGGQTGVDRAALDAALTFGIPCDGWCPLGRRAEDGVISAHYPLRELPSCEYRERTLRNVRDTDGTLIVTFGPPTGGTALTRKYCSREKKPCLLIDGGRVSIDKAAADIHAFVDAHVIRRLNVAGPRASQQPQGYAYTYALLIKLLEDLLQQNGTSD